MAEWAEPVGYLTDNMPYGSLDDPVQQRNNAGVMVYVECSGPAKGYPNAADVRSGVVFGELADQVGSLNAGGGTGKPAQVGGAGRVY